MTGVEAKRYTNIGSKPIELRVNHNFEPIRVVPEKGDVVGIELKYTISYGHLGMLRMEGIIYHKGDQEDIQMQWEEKHQLPKKLMVEMQNFVFRKMGNYECLILSHMVDLPPPFPPNIPMVKPGDEKGKKDGKNKRESISYGPEFA